MKRYTIQVRNKRSGAVIETISRVLRAEQIGNFNPLFCTYKANKRCLVKSDAGDVSDPFRREESYQETFYIEVAPMPAQIIIEGRRWFQKTYGNTYHSVSVTIDGVTTRSGQHYGYGEQYLQTAVECLLKDYFSDYNAFCQDRRDNPKRYHIIVQDVTRERDL